MRSSGKLGALVVWTVFAVLFIVHQDVWFWNDPRLVFGWLPIGLAWHTGFSIAAALLWAAAIRWAWPHQIEAWAELEDSIDDEAANS